MTQGKSKEFYSEADQIADSEAFLVSVKEGFKELEDPRAQDNQTYPLVSLLIVILSAILAGANTIIDIHLYAQVKSEMFQRLLNLRKVPVTMSFGGS